MDTKPHFRNIRRVITEQISDAKKEIYIAMVWFTNHGIFDAVVEKAREIPVHVVVDFCPNISNIFWNQSDTG